MYFSPVAEICNPTKPEWAYQEMECIGHQGEVKPRSCNHSNTLTLFDHMELIEVSTVKAVYIPSEIYEASVDATISAAYFYETNEVDLDETRT